jgi:hypothetical protein
MSLRSRRTPATGDTRRRTADTAFILQKRNTAQRKLIVARSRLAIGRRTHQKHAPETDFRHAGLASTEPNRMNAALMRLERHERGIHVV